MNTQNLTPIEDWLDAFEEVTLPSGKRVGLRQVDVLSILTEDGQVPNFLMPIVRGYIDPNAATPDEAGQIEMSAEDALQFMVALNRLTRACWAWPPLVNDAAAEERHEGIQLFRISTLDKMALVSWAMGGQAALDAGKKALAEQIDGLATVPSGDGVSTNPQRNSQRKKPVAGGPD